MMKQNDLLERTFVFGINCLKFLRQLPTDYEYRLIRFQLRKSAISLGANYKNPKLALQEPILRIKFESR